VHGEVPKSSAFAVSHGLLFSPMTNFFFAVNMLHFPFDKGHLSTCRQLLKIYWRLAMSSYAKKKSNPAEVTQWLWKWMCALAIDSICNSNNPIKLQEMATLSTRFCHFAKGTFGLIDISIGGENAYSTNSNASTTSHPQKVGYNKKKWSNCQICIQ